MAITLADFNKIWASSSPLTPYSFTENNYKQGWNFIGSTPPARQMWDFLQKNNDEKMQYLANNYLPLSGGTMTGDITFGNTGNHHIKTNGSSRIGILSGAGTPDGACLLLNSRDWTSNAGEFTLRASDKTDWSDTQHNAIEFVGKPDGTLTWGGVRIVTATTENISSGITVTDEDKVAITEINAFRFGKVVQLSFVGTPTTTVTPGGTASAKLHGLPSPIRRINFPGYISDVAVIASIAEDLSLSIRVINRNINTYGIFFSVVYITNL